MNKTPSNQTSEALGEIAPEGTHLFSPWLRIGSFSLAYCAAQILAFQFPESFGLVAAISPAAGVALAALLLSPRRLWPVLLGCLFMAGLAANLTTPRPFSASLGFMFANICETAASAWLITRFCGEQIRFVRIREVMALAAAAILVNATTSLIGAATAYHSLGVRFLTFYGTWWIADGLGLLLVTPLIVAWAKPRQTRAGLRRWQTIETACLFALGCTAAWFSFGRETVDASIEITPYLLPIFVLWGALCLSTRGTVTLLAALSVIVIGCTAVGIGPFPLGGADAPLHLLAMQVYLGVLGLTGLMIAASVAQQRESHAMLQAVVDGNCDAIYVKDRHGRYLLSNLAAARFVGKTARDMIGKDDTALFPPGDAKTVMQSDQSVMAAAATRSYEERVTGGTGEPHVFFSTKGPIHDENGEVVGLFGIARDVTHCKKGDGYRDMSLKVLQILNSSDGWSEVIGRVLAFIKTQTGTDAVGLRLQDGEDFPYFAEVGFSDDFLLTENALVERGSDGGVCRDKDGRVCLECTCGLVLSGKTDPANPLFTRGGSCWTNDSAPLLDLPPEQDPRHHPRNKCILQGYASVALIPIRDKERIVGLLHLNARRKGCFSHDTVKILEDLAAHIGAARMRKQAEESLNESEQRYRSLFFGMTEGFAIHELILDKQGTPCDYRFLTVNPAFERLTGIKAENLVGKSPRQVLSGESLFFIENYSQVALTGEPAHGEHHSPILQRHFSVYAYRPGPNQFATIISDITQQKRFDDVQTFLAQTSSGGAKEPFFDALARYLAQSLGMDCVCIDRLEDDGLHAHRVAVWCDGRFEDNVTYALKDTPCGDVVGKQVCCFPSSVCQFFPRDQVLKDRRAESYVGVTLFGHTGKPVGLIAVIGRGPLANRPLTEAVLKLVAVRAASEIERQDAEVELQKLDKLQSVSTLAGGIAHDFNNILQGLYGNISLAIEDLAEAHPSYPLLKKAEKSMTRAIRLTKQLLTFAKGGDPVKKHVSLEAMTEEIARFDLTGSNVSLVYHHDADLWPVDADRGQIQQVISNLVINARQAMSSGGHLHVTLENADLPAEAVPGLSAGRYVKGIVQDEGCGIDPKVINRIFDPYFSTKQTGHGLGLSMVWSIIYKHGGHIGVVSELGKGATFTFYLPVSSSRRSAVEESPSAKIPSPASPAKILVMDDEVMVCDLASKMLSRYGYTVATAPNGQEAIALYRQALDAGAPFDLAIMDLTIPGGPGGKEVIKDLMALDPKVRALVSSGYADDPVMARPAKYGFHGTLAKPYTAKALHEAVTRTLA